MLRMTIRALAAATAAALLAIMLLPSAADAQRLSSDKAKKNASPKHAPSADTTRAPTGMALVPGGPFTPATTKSEAETIADVFRMDKRGRARFEKFVSTELVNEKRRKVEVPGFFLNRNECPNRQYYHFMMATGAAPPNLHDDHSARWREGRLPGATQLLFVDEVKNWPVLVQRIQSGAKSKNASRPIGRVWDLLDKKIQSKLKRVDAKKELKPELPAEIVRAINAVLMRRDFYDAKFFRGIVIRGSVGREALALQNKGKEKLDEYEVTRLNRIYLDDTLKGCIERGQPQEMMLYPVTGLTYFQAKACAEWMGKRLPTEMEWEKGARGAEDPRWYPWGSEFGRKQMGHCNWALYWASGLNKDMRPEGLCPIGTFPKGATPYGALDMVGNAIEMVDSMWAPHKNALRGKGIVFDPPENEACCIIKGGGYGEMFKEHLRIPFRYPWKKSESSDAVGFRCAKDTVLGKTALTRIATDLFQGMWDSRIIKLDPERGLAALEKVKYDKEFPDHAIVTEYSWIGFVNIRDHLYDSAKALRNASDKVRRKKRGHIFLGVFHTDAAFASPKLRSGNYAIVYQRGFKILNTKEKKADKKGDKKKTGKKSKKKPDRKKKKKKKSSKKKDRTGKGKKKPAPKPPQDKPADEKKKATTPVGIPEFSPVPRILFVDAAGRPVAALENPVIRTINKNDQATMTITPAVITPESQKPAVLTLHLTMLKKYEKRKSIVVDIPLTAPLEGKPLEGYGK